MEKSEEDAGRTNTGTPACIVDVVLDAEEMSSTEDTLEATLLTLRWQNEL